MRSIKLDPENSLTIKLRKIGFLVWDPIGLAKDDADGDGPPWMDPNFGDEYDTYLYRAYAMRTEGAGIEEIAAYLDKIAAVHMGLGYGSGDVSPSRSAAVAILELRT
ncbi:MAG: hypothetical protein WBG08_14415 [Litorimonas sp.]